MSKNQGEGDYVSGKKYQDAQHRFAKEGPVEEAGREAADALSGPEAKALEDARVASAQGRPLKAASPGRLAHQDHKLDEALDQSFPASDPASTSPGAD